MFPFNIFFLVGAEGGEEGYLTFLKVLPSDLASVGISSSSLEKHGSSRSFLDAFVHITTRWLLEGCPGKSSSVASPAATQPGYTK
jgi:hypothetical protein